MSANGVHPLVISATFGFEGWLKIWIFFMKFMKIDEQDLDLFEFYDGIGN
jgi:hypothetical protein